MLFLEFRIVPMNFHQKIAELPPGLAAVTLSIAVML
jgi:hypothetical protein